MNYNLNIGSIQLETSPSPLCATPYSGGGKSYSFSPFSVVLCAECGLWYLLPRMPEAALLATYRTGRYFEEGGEFGYKGTYSGYAVQENSFRATFRSFIRHLQRKNLTGGSLLEIGAGYGLFLTEARRWFSSVAGTEYAAEAVNQCREKGLPLIQGGLAEIPRDQRFDLIVSTNVIEHVYAPAEFTTRLSRFLRPGGWVVLATPDMGSPLRTLLGRKWPSFKIPEHVSFFNAATLQKLLIESGAHQTTAIPYLHYFPLGLLGEKFGIRLPPSLGKRSVPVPFTMIAMAGKWSPKKSPRDQIRRSKNTLQA